MKEDRKETLMPVPLSTRASVSRRLFLQSAVGTTVYLLAASDGFGFPLLSLISSTASQAAPSLTIARPDDFLLINFSFVNLRLDLEASPVRLVRAGQGPAYLIVGFPPQAIAEEVVKTGDRNLEARIKPKEPVRKLLAKEVPKTGDRDLEARIKRKEPVRKWLANWSRLVFRVPDDIPSITYNLESLLDWSRYTLNVKQTQASHPPNALETAIEAPALLWLSPDCNARFAHSVRPVTHNDWTELWHTRLVKRIGLVNNAQGVPVQWVEEPADLSAGAPGCANQDLTDNQKRWPRLFAIRSENFPEGEGFQTSLSDNESDNRKKIVELAEPQSRFPTPILAQQYMLTSLGANLDVALTRNISGCVGNDLTAWRHVATLGRDQYVRIARQGYLYPFWHAATLEIITERTFGDNDDGTTSGYLAQKSYILPQELVRPNDVDNPFSRINIDPEKTPEIIQVAILDISREDAFWPVTVAGEKYSFKFEGQDRNEASRKYGAPAIWISACITSRNLEKVIRAYENAKKEQEVQFQNRKIYYAEPDRQAVKETSPVEIETDYIVFDGGKKFMEKFREMADEEKDKAITLIANEIRRCRMKVASVKVPAVGELVGLDRGVKIEFDKNYIDNGFDRIKNAGQVFVKMAEEEEVRLNFQTQARQVANEVQNGIQRAVSDARAAAGVIAPNVSIAGLSREVGAVGAALKAGAENKLDAIKNAALGQFNPRDILKDLKLFGTIDLAEFLPDEVKQLKDAPKLLTNKIKDAQNRLSKLEAVYEWETKFDKAREKKIFERLNAQSRLKITMRATKNILSNEPPETSLTCSITDFKINILAEPNFISVSFKEFSIVSVNGGKPKVTPRGMKVEFAEALKFIQNLAELLGLSKDKGPWIEITPELITASYRIPFPQITLGAYNLLNISILIAVDISLLGDPLLFRFCFSSRENPFLLTSGMYGGGGYVCIGVRGKELHFIEASFRFGAIVSIDVAGIATGQAFAMGGFVYNITKVDGENRTTLTGFINCGGSVKMWGFITYSVNFYLGLDYDPGQNILHGEAELSVSVKIGFFTKSASFKVRRRFAGGEKSNQGPLAYLASRDTSQVGQIPGLAVAPAPLEFTDFMTKDQWDEYVAAFN